jgi:Holliday junction DNA helicase RuvB
MNMEDAQPNKISDAAPASIYRIIGQGRAVAQIKVALDAYFNERASNPEQAALPHVLMVGPPGVGKSMLASVVAKELAVGFHEELAQNISSPRHLQGLLMLAEPGDVVFVDEIHELPPTVQTTLYRCLEERRLFLGGDKKAITLPPFTFIGATTDEWALSKPLLDRMKITLRLQHYSEEELTKLVKQRTTILGWSITDEAIAGIAHRGRNTPRLALRLLEACRRHQRADNSTTITEAHLERMCQVEGVDDLGLDITERRYLEILREAQGEPVRLNMIASRLSLPRRTVEKILEGELVRLGLVTKTDEGRMLTAAGAKHLVAQEPSKEPK